MAGLLGWQAAGIVPKGGRKKGVASRVTPPDTGGGGVTGDARGGVTGVPTLASPVTLNVYSPANNPLRDDASRPSVPTPEVGAREAGYTDGGTDGVGGNVVQEEKPGAAGDGAPAAAGAAPDNDKNAPTRGGDPCGGWSGAAPAHRQATDGLEILRRVGLRVAKLKLAGKPLADQALRLDGLLAQSEHLGIPWSPWQLIEMLSAPFEEEIRTSAGAVVSHRIGLLPVTPDAPRIPGQGGPDETSAEDGTADWDLPPSRAGSAAGPGRRDLSTSAEWSWAEKRAALESAARDDRGCAADEGTCRRLAVEGELLCAEHLGWPECIGGCRTRARSGVCAPCEAAGAPVGARRADAGRGVPRVRRPDVRTAGAALGRRLVRALPDRGAARGRSADAHRLRRRDVECDVDAACGGGGPGGGARSPRGGMGAGARRGPAGSAVLDAARPV